jgi:transposase-like protein
MRYFEDIGKSLEVKRFRCPKCSKIFIVLPKGIFKRYQTGIQKIFQTLSLRISSGMWSPAISRQRAGHWLRKFTKKARMDFPQWQLEVLLPWLYEREINFLA